MSNLKPTNDFVFKNYLEKKKMLICKRISTKLEQWLLFIINENMEEIKMVDNKCIIQAKRKFL